MLLVLNGHHDLVQFTLPPSGDDAGWTLLVDTNLPQLPDRISFPGGEKYAVTARSLLLFKLGS
jgi:glycogen operon protein